MKKIILLMLLPFSILSFSQINYVVTSDTISIFKCCVNGNYINLPSTYTGYPTVDSLNRFKNPPFFSKLDNLCMLYFKMIEYNGKYYYILFEEYEHTRFKTSDVTRYRGNSYSGSANGTVNGKSYNIQYNIPYTEEYTTKHTDIITYNTKKYTIFNEKDYIKLFSQKESIHINSCTDDRWLLPIDNHTSDRLTNLPENEKNDIIEKLSNYKRGFSTNNKYFQIKKENNIVKFKLPCGLDSDVINDLDCESYIMSLGDLYKLYIHK